MYAFTACVNGVTQLGFRCENAKYIKSYNEKRRTGNKD